MPSFFSRTTPLTRLLLWSSLLILITGLIALFIWQYAHKKMQQPEAPLYPSSSAPLATLPKAKPPEVTSSTKMGWKVYTNYQSDHSYRLEIPESWNLTTYKDGTAAFDPVQVISEADYARFDLAPGAITIRPGDAWTSGVIGVSSMEKRMIGIRKAIETRYSKKIGTPDNSPNPFWMDRTSEIYYGWNNTLKNQIELMYLNTDAKNTALQNTIQQILDSVERL